jgi:chromosomal replication initiator protein
MINQKIPNREVEEIWKLACADLQLQLSSAAYTTWILTNPLTKIVVDQNKATATISALTAFHATNLKKNLYTQLKNSIEKILHRTVEVEFKVSDPFTDRATTNQPSTKAIKKQDKAAPSVPKPSFSHDTQSSVVQSHASSSQANLNHQHNNNNFSQVWNKSIKSSDNLSPSVEDLFSTNTIQATFADRAITSARRIGLRLDYVFKNFAVSTTNEMAHAAAVAVSNNPGSTYNPLFLYGGVGVGKTHLMQAIGHNILKKNPESKVLYCTGEEFTNEIIGAIRNKKAGRFKEKYRNTQVLLIDDVQFIAGKNAVQEEFFHTFNALTKQAAQVVLTSDRSPHEINLLEDRLKSRFEAGLMIDIQAPSSELRTAIVLIKSQASNVIIPMDLAQTIAERVNGARRIEGVITKIRSEIELKGKTLNQALVEDILSRENTFQTTTILRVKPDDVIKKVAKFYRLTNTALKGKKRNKEIALARHMAMYIIKIELSMSYVEVGKWFSNRDHTTIMHAITKIERLLIENNMIAQDLDDIKKALLKISR